METKKSIRADLEKKKGLFLQLGLIISLGAALVAFEWRTPYNPKLSDSGTKFDPIPIDIVPITRQEDKKEPVPVKPVITAINIVDNTVDVTDDPIIDAEANPDSRIETYVPSNITTKTDDETGIEDPNEIFIAVEEDPSYNGGYEAMQKYLAENIKYPQIARETGIQGTVYLTFIVERNGSVTDVKILRAVGGGCDEEAVRVVENMPKWNPGLQRGKPVRVKFTMPIKFSLAN